jgi:hypothetical protein
MPDGIILDNENTYLSVQVASSSQKGTIISNENTYLTGLNSFRYALGTLPYSFPKTSRTEQQKQEWYN